MKGAIAVLLILFVASFVFAGCAKQTDVEKETSTELTSDVSEIDALSDELDTSELEGLEDDLDLINW